MAHFRNEPEEWQRMDYLILREGSICLYFQNAVLDESIDWLRRNEYHIDEFNTMKWDTEELMHDDFSDTLSFPDYYGRNLDALNDCMSDIEIPINSGRAMVFRGYDVFNSRFPHTAQIVLDIFDETSRSQMVFGERLVGLVQSDDPTLRFERTGRYGARWNGREWLNSSRGL
jgi:RNAse (barnase) inhibitor barstar